MDTPDYLPFSHTVNNMESILIDGNHFKLHTSHSESNRRDSTIHFRPSVGFAHCALGDLDEFVSAAFDLTPYITIFYSI